MKIKIFLRLLPLLALLHGCKEKEKPMLFDGYVQVQEFSFGLTTDFSKRDAVGAEVTTYRTEADFWLERNPVHKGYTSERGYFYLYKDAPKHDENTYWVKVKYKEKNNYRSMLRWMNDTVKQYSYLWPQYRGEKSYQYPIRIEPTPTKLQLKVFHQGNPVKGAQVDMYLSKEDYMSFQDFDTKGFLGARVDYICTSSFRHLFIRDDSDKIIKDSYRGETDAEGLTSICYLEPRKYWIRVRKDGKSNDNTFFETDSLPNDVNLQNYYEIAIQ